jgi:hypothetical protein
MDSRNLFICFRNRNSGTVEECDNMFQGVGCTENATSGEGSRKRREYLCFDQLLFLLPHVQDRETQINLSNERNEDEEEANSSQEEEKERPRNV